MSNNVPGTEGYAESAALLANEWRQISFRDHHAAVLHLLPVAPSRILDVGSGMGRDAAALAAMGHSVVAVEPLDELRSAAINFYPAANVFWLDDSLPELRSLRARNETFSTVMITAVWMHLDEAERRRAMSVIADLMDEGGHLIMSLRHGPVPIGRRMFDVGAEETIALAEVNRLCPVLNIRSESVQRMNRSMQVTWTRLAFRKLTSACSSSA